MMVSRTLRVFELVATRRISVANAWFALRHRDVTAVPQRHRPGFIFVCPEMEAMAFGEPTTAAKPCSTKANR